jgi:oligopeptide transport system permease protein
VKLTVAALLKIPSVIRGFLQQIFSIVLTLFLVAMASFIVARNVPGGPFGGEKALPVHIRQTLEQKYGFDKSPIAHFASYLRGILRGDFGPSLQYRDRPVTTILLDTLPISFSLGMLALSWEPGSKVAI